MMTASTRRAVRARPLDLPGCAPRCRTGHARSRSPSLNMSHMAPHQINT